MAPDAASLRLSSNPFGGRRNWRGEKRFYCPLWIFRRVAGGTVCRNVILLVEKRLIAECDMLARQRVRCVLCQSEQSQTGASSFCRNVYSVRQDGVGASARTRFSDFSSLHSSPGIDNFDHSSISFNSPGERVPGITVSTIGCANGN